VRHAAGEDGAFEAVGVHVGVELVAAQVGEVLDVLQRHQVLFGDQRIADVQLLEVQAEGCFSLMWYFAPCWYCCVIAVIMLGCPWMAVRCR
jgi:hypothetical protein